jgi:hypothetical protein
LDEHASEQKLLQQNTHILIVSKPAEREKRRAEPKMSIRERRRGEVMLI